MPRLAGQVDLSKTEAILEAAAEEIARRGLNVPVDDIARRAGVSKQTIYNRYGSKADLVRAVIERRVNLITAPLDEPDAGDHPEETLATFGRALLETVSMPRGVALIRLIVESVNREPELARRVFGAGARASRIRLAAFLAREAKAGRIAVSDPDQAADFFAGMVVSHYQLAGLLGVATDLTPVRIDRIAHEAAHRFMRAYAL
jgi:TetR/AcrR family transcriptional repressor of mexJK operon